MSNLIRRLYHRRVHQFLTVVYLITAVYHGTHGWIFDDDDRNA